MPNKAHWNPAIIVIVSISIILILFATINSLSLKHLWISGARFNQYSEDFIAVKDYVASNFSNQTNKYFTVRRNIYQEVTLYDPDTNEYLRLPDNIAASLQRIYDNGFPYDADLDIIKIFGNRISFRSSKGTYELVYSPDGKPTWLNSPQNPREIHVTSLGNGWYHVKER